MDMAKPKIRFNGYTEDWEQRKVLDLLIQPITDGPHETPKLVEEGVPFISVDAIVDNKIDFNRKRGNISEEYDELCCKKYKPQFHDVYLVKSGSTVGKVAIVETTDRFNIWSPLAAMRCGEKSYPYFLYDLLQTKDLQAQVADKASNGTQPNLSMRELEKFPVSVPSNLEEQKKIGDYFRNLDHLITLHQRKCEQTKTLKKYMLQKMFSQDGEKVPQIRFEGFTEDWEQRKVSELCSISTGKSNTQDKVEDGEYPFYVRSPIIERSTKYLYDEEAVITVGDGVGTGKVFHYVNGKYDLHQRCYRMYGFSDELNAHYFYHTFSKLFYKRVMAMTAKTSVDSVRLEMISDMKIPVPNVEEQRKIGNLLDGIDHLITLHQRKCDELKEVKKFMLQNMFV